MNVLEQSLIDVCVDCIQVLANGVGEPGTVEAAERMTARWGDTMLVAGTSHECETCESAAQNEEESSCDEGWFSWTPCEGCGSTLGGTRFHAVAFTGEESA